MPYFLIVSRLFFHPYIRKKNLNLTKKWLEETVMDMEVLACFRPVFFWSLLTRSNSEIIDGETCFNFTTMRGCMIATNYIDFSFSSSF